ncbi:CPBP family intramembrane glutamic endopeptidase [Nocardioides sp. SLBN-35]|uniref:CPBP family intramembrane glutamic endopeptidase n=1 Tax=Nocardioides sp. SLBN-35 TaxID=2768445 RepID=UPI00116B3E92|nr:CPBP family intramembrane glutamic endopeptidase [Nocardioides sp. SLBN-35]TQK72391.1 membrane protease YdiL (CAAX protease family) [Nocardioides sp. SLBN-35]
MTITTAPVPDTVHERDFHRLARSTPRHRWWRPLAVVALAGVLFLAGTMLAIVPMAVVEVAVPGQDGLVDRLFGPAGMSDPLVATVMLTTIALMLPAALLAVRLAGGRGAGTLSSVTGRLRRVLLVRCVGLGLLLVVPALLAFVTLDGTWQDLAVSGTTAPLLAVALLVVPLQAAAEEYAFRGLLMQTIGAWLRHPAFAIVLPVPLFTLGHEYDLLGLLDVTVFALTAGWLAWRTGGLEAPIGIHVANNAALVAFGAVGLVDLDATEGTWFGLACSVGVTLGYAWLVRGWGDADATSRPRP